MKYWYILGREKLLSAAEIAAVLNIDLPAHRGDILKLDAGIDHIERLGGTVKIGVEIGSDLNFDELRARMIEQLSGSSGKIVFGFSVFGAQEILGDRFGLQIKKSLKESGLSARLIANKNGTINAAQIKYNKILEKGAEFLIESVGQKFNLAKTIAVQDADAYSARDFGRPGRDDVSGMLPPKLAQMMINLAATPIDSTILDPFCGSGTIITEAMIMGYRHILGSDLSERAVADTIRNIEWTRANFPATAGSEVSARPSDARSLTHLESGSIDTVITEPYLGRPLTGRETRVMIDRQVAELRDLYLSSGREIHRVLRPDGRVVMIIPRFRERDQWMTVDIADEIKKIGFVVDPIIRSHEFLLYARPDQHVGREVWRFRKK